MKYCDKLDKAGKDADSWGSDLYFYSQVRNPKSDSSVEATTIDIDAVDGAYIIIEYGAMIFTPYFRDHHTALVDRETWERCQTRMKEEGQKRKKKEPVFDGISEGSVV